LVYVGVVAQKRRGAVALRRRDILGPLELVVVSVGKAEPRSGLIEALAKL
jgi:hypothetical protein